MKTDEAPLGALVAKLLPAVTVVAAVVIGVSVGVELALLVVAAGALAGVIALVFASVLALTGESPLTLDEALTLGAPSAEEEQKRAILRALKDLEFERSVGKISEEDYAELSARYRAEAKRLIELLDHSAEPERARAEELLRQRLEQTKRQRRGLGEGDTKVEAETPSATESEPGSTPAAEPGPALATSASEELGRVTPSGEPAGGEESAS